MLRLDQLIAEWFLERGYRRVLKYEYLGPFTFKCTGGLYLEITICIDNFTAFRSIIFPRTTGPNAYLRMLWLSYSGGNMFRAIDPELFIELEKEFPVAPKENVCD